MARDSHLADGPKSIQLTRTKQTAPAASCQYEAKRSNHSSLESSSKKLRLSVDAMPSRGGRARGRKPEEIPETEQQQMSDCTGGGGPSSGAVAGGTRPSDQAFNSHDPFALRDDDDDDDDDDALALGPAESRERQSGRGDQDFPDDKHRMGARHNGKELRGRPTPGKGFGTEGLTSRHTTASKPEPQLNKPSAERSSRSSRSRANRLPDAAASASLSDIEEDAQHCGVADRDSRGQGPRDVHSGSRRRSRFFGLRNPRNMCYINAVLQSLSGIALFAQMMRVARLQLSMKGNSIFTALGRLLQEMGMRPQSRVALPLDSQPVKLAIGLKWPQFRTPDQQDAHELLCAILDSIHEDVRAAAKIVFLRLPSASASSGQAPQAESQAGRGKEEAEKFADTVCPSCVTFSCTVEQLVECLQCGLTSKSLVEYNHFSIDIPDGTDLPQPFVLQQLIEDYFKGEEFERECEQCTARAKAAMDLGEGEGGGGDQSDIERGEEQKEQHQLPLPKCRVTRQIVRVPHVMVLHLKRFSVQVTEPAQDKDSPPAKENRLSDGNGVDRDAAPEGTGPVPKAAHVYDFVKKQERVTIPRVLAIDAMTAADATGPVSPPDLGATAALSGTDGGLALDLDDKEQASGMGFDVGDVGVDLTDGNAGVGLGDATARDSFHAAPPAPPIPPSFESNRYPMGSRTGRLRREPSPELQRSPAHESGNATRSLRFPASSAGTPGLHGDSGYPGKPLADVTNRGRGLVGLLSNAGLAGEAAEKQQRRRGRQPWKPLEDEKAGWATVMMRAPAFQSRSLWPRNRAEQEAVAEDRVFPEEDKDGEEEPSGSLSSFMRPGLRGGAAASPSRKDPGGPRQGEAGTRAGTQGRRGMDPGLDAGAVPVQGGGQGEGSSGDEVFFSPKTSPGDSSESTKGDTQHQQCPGARAHPPATQGLAGDVLPQKGGTCASIAALAVGGRSGQEAAGAKGTGTGGASRALPQLPRGDALINLFARGSSDEECETPPAKEPSWSRNNMLGILGSELPQAQERRRPASRAASPLMDREEIENLERAIALSKAEAEAKKREKEEREAQEKAVAMSLREQEGAGAPDASTPIPDKEQAELDEAIRQSLLEEEQLWEQYEEGPREDRCADGFHVELGDEQVQVQETGGTGGVAATANRHEGENAPDVASAQGHPAAALFDPGLGSGLVEDQGAGLRAGRAATSHSTWGLGAWGLRKKGPSQGQSAAEDPEDRLSLPLRERLVYTYDTGPITLGENADELVNGGCDAAADQATAEGIAPLGDEEDKGKGAVKSKGQRNRKKGVWNDRQWGPADNSVGATAKHGAGRIKMPKGSVSTCGEQDPERTAAATDVQAGVGSVHEMALSLGGADSPKAAPVLSPAAVEEFPDAKEALSDDGSLERPIELTGSPGARDAGTRLFTVNACTGASTRGEGLARVEEEVYGQHVYALRAVVHHLGRSAHHGHYVADVLDEVAEQWVHHDDSSLNSVPFSEVSSVEAESTSYLMFYVRVDARSRPIQVQA